MVVRMRHNRSQTRSRRSHHGLRAVATGRCPQCHSSMLSHRACPGCGFYRGRAVVQMTTKDKNQSGGEK